MVYSCISKLDSTEMSLSNVESLGGEGNGGGVGMVEVVVPPY